VSQDRPEFDQVKHYCLVKFNTILTVSTAYMLLLWECLPLFRNVSCNAECSY